MCGGEYSLRSYACCRPFADISCTYAEDAPFSEPPYATLAKLTDEVWLARQTQHYFYNHGTMHDSGVYLSGDGPGIDMGYELVGKNTYTLPMFLTPPSTRPNATPWTIPGRLRFRVVRRNHTSFSDN